MSNTVTISPLTRIEGHLAIHTETEPQPGGSGVQVTQAHCEGEMFRGLGVILVGRDPLDAQQIMQRTCGVCPIAHGMASVRAQEEAYGIRPVQNGRLLQNLIASANYLHSHILHFYHLAALDFVDVTAVLNYTGSDRTLLKLKAWAQSALDRKDVFPAAPFLPRYEGDYVSSTEINCALLGHYADALKIRRTCDEMGAVFGARLPHSTALLPGGCTQKPTLERILAYRSRLDEVLAFVEDVYLPDLFEVGRQFPQYFEIGRGWGNFLAYGSFEMDDSGRKFFPPGTLIDGKWETFDPRHISEDVSAAWYEDGVARHPFEGETRPKPGKPRAYSWIKAPRYRGLPLEVGPLARVLVNYHAGENGWARKPVDAACEKLGITPDKLVSVMGRHVTRGLETLALVQQCFRWLDEIGVDQPAVTSFEFPKSGQGAGLVEAPRGALGHWLTIEDYKVKTYQSVVPTTWNCSPRDSKGQSGPVEKALEGTQVANASQPIELGRIVRSFDPCLACAVH